MKTLSIQEVESSSSTVVWALNATKGAHKGSVIFTVPSSTSGGNVDSVVIPMTFLPIDLTEQVTKTQLLQSSQFRKAVTTGMLMLITDEEAAQFYSMPGADKEKDRLLHEMINGITDDSHSDQSGVVIHESERNTEGNVLPAVLTLMVDASEKDEITVVNSLRTLKSDMTQADYNYVMDIAKEFGLKKVEKHCKNNLSV